MEGADRPFRMPPERAVTPAGRPCLLGTMRVPGWGGDGAGSPVLEDASWLRPRGHCRVSSGWLLLTPTLSGAEWVVWPAAGRKMSSALNFTFAELSLMGLTWQMEMWAAVFPRENLEPSS